MQTFVSDSSVRMQTAGGIVKLRRSGRVYDPLWVKIRDRLDISSDSFLYRNIQRCGPERYRLRDLVEVTQSEMVSPEISAGEIQLDGNQILRYLDSNGLMPRTLSIEDGLAIISMIEWGEFRSMFRRAGWGETDRLILWRSMFRQVTIHDGEKTHVDMVPYISEANGVFGLAVRWVPARVPISEPVLLLPA